MVRVRRVYRHRPLVVMCNVIVAGLAAVALLPSGPGLDAGPGLMLAALTAVLAWISYFPRTVVGPEGIRLYSMARSRSIPWSKLDSVAVRPDGSSRGGELVFTVNGTDIAATAPAIARSGWGRRRLHRIVQEIEHARRRATEVRSGERSDAVQRQGGEKDATFAERER